MKTPKGVQLNSLNLVDSFSFGNPANLAPISISVVPDGIIKDGDTSHVNPVQVLLSEVVGSAPKTVTKDPAEVVLSSILP